MMLTFSRTIDNDIDLVHISRINTYHLIQVFGYVKLELLIDGGP